MFAKISALIICLCFTKPAQASGIFNRMGQHLANSCNALLDEEPAPLWEAVWLNDLPFTTFGKIKAIHRILDRLETGSARDPETFHLLGSLMKRFKELFGNKARKKVDFPSRLDAWIDEEEYLRVIERAKKIFDSLPLDAEAIYKNKMHVYYIFGWEQHLAITQVEPLAIQELRNPRVESVENVKKYLKALEAANSEDIKILGKKLIEAISKSQLSNITKVNLWFSVISNAFVGVDSMAYFSEMLPGLSLENNLHAEEIFLAQHHLIGIIKVLEDVARTYDPARARATEQVIVSSATVERYNNLIYRLQYVMNSLSNATAHQGVYR